MTEIFHHSYPELSIDQPVYFQDVAKKHWSPGIIIGYGPEPRSYTVLCEQTGSKLGRNRSLQQHRYTTLNDTVLTPELLPDTPLVQNKPVISQVPQNQLKSGSTSELQSQPRPAPTPQPCTTTEVTVASPGTPPTPTPRRSLMKNDEKTQAKTTVTRLGRISKPSQRYTNQWNM